MNGYSIQITTTFNDEPWPMVERRYAGETVAEATAEAVQVASEVYQMRARRDGVDSTLESAGFSVTVRALSCATLEVEPRDEMSAELTRRGIEHTAEADIHACDDGGAWEFNCPKATNGELEAVVRHLGFRRSTSKAPGEHFMWSRGYDSICLGQTSLRVAAGRQA